MVTRVNVIVDQINENRFLIYQIVTSVCIIALLPPQIMNGPLVSGYAFRRVALQPTFYAFLSQKPKSMCVEREKFLLG